MDIEKTDIEKTDIENSVASHLDPLWSNYTSIKKRETSSRFFIIY